MRVFVSKNTLFFYWLIVGLFLFVPPILSGQEVNTSSSFITVITGKVSPNEPVMIIAKSEDGKRIFGYTSPDSDGNYTLRLSNNKEAKINLYVSGLGVKAQNILIENKSVVHNISVEKANLNIKEVTVTAEKITQKNDTVTYYMPTYTKEEDNTLKDALKRLPGIEVKEDGQLMYNGKWVGELYIEGLNMLDSRYGVAVNNINAKDVAAVQVMERHQKIKMLQGKQSGSAPAINIKLKESAKSTWSSRLSLAAGRPKEWDASVNAMMFARKMQNISFLKSNNVGVDLGGELGVSTRLSSPVKISQPSMPTEIAEPLYYDNESYSGSISQLHKTGDDSQISFTINYLSDKYMRENSSISEYYTGEGGDDDILTINESNSSVSYDKALVGAVSYKLNSNKTYLVERLNVMFNKENSSSSTVKNQSPVSQTIGGNTLSLKNDFRLSWGGYNNFKDFNSKLSFETSDADLCFGGETLSDQLYRGTKFSSENTLPLLSKKIPFARIGLSAIANMEYERNKFSNGDGVENSIGRTVVDAQLQPSFVVGKKKLELTAFIPMGYELYVVSGDGIANTINHSPLILPTVNLSYKANSKMTLGLVYSYYRNMVSPSYLAGGERYSNYRTIVSNPNSIVRAVNRSNMALLSMEYKNTFSMVFANLNVGASLQDSDAMLDYDYSDGSFTSMSYVSEKNSSFSVQVNQAASKGFYWGNTKLYESLTAVVGESPYSIGGQVYSARSRRLSGKFSAGTSPFDWLSLDAGADVSASQTGVLGTWGGTIVSASANFMSGIAISRGLFFSADAKFYYNNHNSAKALFIGCGLEYKYKDWQFFLTCDNLADVKSYETTILSGVNTFYHQYKLCGRRIMLGFQCRLF